MKPAPENFIAFFTVCGFFIGLTFSIISIDGAFEIVIFTALITFSFYMLAHISIMNFIDVKKIGGRIFNKEDVENSSNVIIGDLALREKKMDHILIKLNEERKELAKNEAKERRRNAKKRSA
ncbi:hypothetical protein [Campylobacter troglodytis]|uniref:hypothetical protein n=1 Tax=Campylobacter troglodytis TaxID=654363 RepID=UPI0011584A6F|nr:hypothetical protein [Campylobacter troglodytis]TQR56889.1 hypothetical protein DMC01_08930 [Campylobacter troglodytis]